LFIFGMYSFRSRIVERLINLIVRKKLSRLNERRILSNNRMISNVLSVISALHYVPLFMDRTWLLLVLVKTPQLLHIRCVVIQLVMNR